MKKYLGALSAGLTSILMFVFLSIPCLTLNVANNTTTNNYSGWQILSGVNESSSTIFSSLDSYGLLKTFTIILLVIGCLLAVLAIIMLLQNTKIIKVKFNFNFINVLLQILFCVSVIVIMIAMSNLNSDLNLNGDLGTTITQTIKTYYTIGMGTIFNLIVGVIATVLSFLGMQKVKKGRK